MNIIPVDGHQDLIIRNTAENIREYFTQSVTKLHNLPIIGKVDSFHKDFIDSYANSFLVKLSKKLPSSEFHTEMFKPFAEGFFIISSIAAVGTNLKGAFTRHFHQAAVLVALIQITDNVLKYYPKVRAKMKEIARAPVDEVIRYGDFSRIAPHQTHDKDLLLFSIAFMVSSVANIDASIILNTTIPYINKTIPVISGFNLQRLATHFHSDLNIHFVIGTVFAITLLSNHLFAAIEQAFPSASIDLKAAYI